MNDVKKLLIVSFGLIICNTMNVYAGYNYNNTYTNSANNNKISIDMNDVAELIDAINAINNDNISDYNCNMNHPKVNNVQKQTVTTQLNKSKIALEYANKFAEVVQIMSSGNYSDDVLVSCYANLIYLEDYIKHKSITFNKTTENRAFAAIQKFIPLVNYIADNCKELLKQSNLPVYGSNMYEQNNNAKKRGILSYFFR